MDLLLVQVLSGYLCTAEFVLGVLIKDVLEKFHFDSPMTSFSP